MKRKLINFTILCSILIFSGCSKNLDHIPQKHIETTTSTTINKGKETSVVEYIEETTTEKTTLKEKETVLEEPETIFSTTIEETISQTSTSEHFLTVETTEDEIKTSFLDNDIDVNTNNYFTVNQDYKKYFSNDLFIGDSVCSGLNAYNILDVKNCAAKGNVGSWSIDDYTFQYECSTDEKPVEEIISLYKPGKIFLWMGLNDINIISSEQRITNIQTMIDKYRELSPDSLFFVLSITPIDKNHKWNNGKSGSLRIEQYNEDMKEYCLESDNITYIDVASSIKDTNGFLDPTFDGGDGLHLDKTAYFEILDAIIQQTN